MYEGIPCSFAEGSCCYNTDKWCPGFDGTNPAICERYDRGAYPFGDKAVYSNQMSDPYAMAPFPNAIYWNWATIFILGLGNLSALDFQGRCMAAKTPWAARWGCLIAGCFTIFIGVPFSYLGAITRYVKTILVPLLRLESSSCDCLSAETHLFTFTVHLQLLLRPRRDQQQL